MRNFRRLLENLIDGYVQDPVVRQELLVNFLLVYLEYQPSFYYNIIDLEFIQRIEDLGFQVIIKDNICIMINPKHSRIKTQPNSGSDIFQIVFIFKKNGIETRHLEMGCNPSNVEDHLLKIVSGLNEIQTCEHFLDFEVFLNITCKNNS